MVEPRPVFSSFRRRLLAREQLVGTFLKLPTTQVIEILGSVGYDFVIIDQEHAALDRGITDLMILAARASNIAPVVRVPEFTEAHVLSALDSGAMGVMVPHVSSVEKAQAVARSARYGSGSRGFAGLTRASGWGRFGSVAHMAAQDAEIAVIAMIEDQDAVPLAADIARVDGIDALFIGRGDLTASFADDPEARAKVAAMANDIAVGARAADVPLMMLPSGRADLDFSAGSRRHGLRLFKRSRFYPLCRGGSPEGTFRLMRGRARVGVALCGAAREEHDR